eukprot:scaffold1270_cov71-Cylindrotheca_fusiformis.AAC.1
METPTTNHTNDRIHSLPNLRQTGSIARPFKRATSCPKDILLPDQLDDDFNVQSSFQSLRRRSRNNGLGTKKKNQVRHDPSRILFPNAFDRLSPDRKGVQFRLRRRHDRMKQGLIERQDRIIENDLPSRCQRMRIASDIPLLT